MKELAQQDSDPPQSAPVRGETIPRGMSLAVGGAFGGALVSIMLTRGGGNGPREHFLIGLLLGASWGLTTLAAGWFALGPGRFGLRAIESCVLCGGVLSAVAVSVFSSSRRDLELVAVVATCVAAQWLLLQIPLWSLRRGFGFELRHKFAADIAGGRLQFGMRHLMLFTAVIGVLLGAGRMLVTTFNFSILRGESPVFALLTVAAMVTTLPLLLSLFVRSYFVPAVVLATAFIAGVVPAQLQLLATMRTPGPDLWHLIWINAFQAGWIFVIGGIVRWYGYRLVRSP